MASHVMVQFTTSSLITGMTFSKSSQYTRSQTELDINKRQRSLTLPFFQPCHSIGYRKNLLTNYVARQFSTQAYTSSRNYEAGLLLTVDHLAYHCLART